ncbi:hypothetical protein OEZ86_012333 [Tetradesmus obliquus]|nr:hypothetical protein OEZ86_012333 [Tetradesmus obliquus]
MGARIAQLRTAFGLDEGEELYGQFSCAHTRPRWGAQFLQGQLYVFSSVMVFHANLLAVIKVERIAFKDVQVIRKRSFMRMPNTIAVVRCDPCSGATRDDVFTSFLFASRRKAFELMVARWRAANPKAADAYLSSLASSSGPSAGLLPGSSSGSISGDYAAMMSSGGSDAGGPGSAAAAAAAASPLHFPAWREVAGPAAERLLVLPPGMALMAGVTLPGVTARSLAEVLLSDQSGFLPSVYRAQGNELVSLTPWQVCSGRHPSPSAPHVQPPPGSLSRTLQYIYSTSGPWGAVRSLVVQEQLLLAAPGGRLVLLITQRMPDLPAGAGKCFYMTIRWDISPAAADPAAAAAPAGAAEAVTAGAAAEQWAKIEKDCVATAAASLADIVAQGQAWLADEGLRVSLAEVMPQAAAAVAAQRHQHTAGGRPLRGQGVHRRSGSAGSSSALRLAAAGKTPGHPLARSSSSSSVMALPQGMFGRSTISAAAAAAILRSMPKTLSKVNLQLQSNGHGCSMIRAELEALPNLQSISIACPGAAACLLSKPILSTTFSQLTSIRLGTIRSPAEVAKLLRGLPASLPQLRLDVGTPDRAPGGIAVDRILQALHSVQMAHLTALTTLHVTRKRFFIEEESTLPPNPINLTVPCVMHERPLMQLSRLQRLDVNSIDSLLPEGFAGIALCLTQLTHMNIDMLYMYIDVHRR